MNPFEIFDVRPIVVAVAGPNGAGKTTFYYSHLAATGLRFVNADALAPARRSPEGGGGCRITQALPGSS